MVSYWDTLYLNRSKEGETLGNNRSVMPLDILECTRDTITKIISLFCLISFIESLWTKPSPKGVGNLKILVLTRIVSCNRGMKEEYLVGVSQHLAPIKSLLFVHTARRIKEHDWSLEAYGLFSFGKRGSKLNGFNLTMMKS